MDPPRLTCIECGRAMVFQQQYEQGAETTQVVFLCGCGIRASVWLWPTKDPETTFYTDEGQCVTRTQPEIPR